MPLTPEQWQRVKEIVAAALQLERQERDAFVQQCCGQDLPLAEEVMSLLRYDTSYPTAAEPKNFMLQAPAGVARGDLLKQRYSLGEPLAQGGFSTTYMAFDQQLHDRRVVVKILSPFRGDPYIYRKFQDELMALSALEHPNIVAPLDSGTLDDGTPFLVMQYAEGQTLRAVFSNCPLAFARVASFVRQVGRALAAVHDKGIYHRDLKPENIIVQTFEDGSEYVRLIDFGIASIVDQGVASAVTRVVGTVRYMAPEQLRGEVSPRTDIYALGVLAYEALTGAHPFSAVHLPELLEMQKAGVRVLPTQLRPTLPAAAQALILEALSFQPARRPADVAGFAERLATALSEPTNARLTSVPLHRGALLAVAALLVLFMFVAIRFWRRDAAPTSARQQETVRETPALKRANSVTAPLRLTVEIRTKDGGVIRRAVDTDAIGLKQDQSFRFLVAPTAAGHLYLLSETANAPGLHILFPSPTANGGESAVRLGQAVEVPEKSWLAFGRIAGVEKVWFVWSAMRQPQLESARKWANSINRGAIGSSDERATIKLLLAGGPELPTVGARLEMRGTGSLDTGFIKIAHR